MMPSFMTNQTPQKCLAGFSLRWAFALKAMREMLCRSGAVRFGSRLMFAMLCLTGMTALAAPPAGNWSLTWSDEFNSGSTPQYPNSTNWGYESGYVRGGEWQYYTNTLENAYCQDGILHIVARKYAPGTFPTGSLTNQDGSISSASLTSQFKVAFQYGWLEMRARIDTRLGSWPAFWTLGSSGQWPDRGECDIMEYYTGHLNFNIAWWETGDTIWTPRWDGTMAYVSALVPAWTNNFHVWAMEWTTNAVNLYLDGVMYNTWDTSLDIVDSSLQGFQQSHFMILNQAIGSSGGDASGLAFPTSYEVDYVRWYQGTRYPKVPITIQNPGFELPGTTKQMNWTSVPGWSSDTVAVSSGVEAGGTSGLWQGYLRGSDPAVWQLTDHVLRAGQTIALSVDAKNSYLATALKMELYYDNAGSRVTLTNQQVSVTTNWETMGWRNYLLVCNVDDVPAAIGHKVGISFANPISGANWLALDNVAVTFSDASIVPAITVASASPTTLTHNARVTVSATVQAGSNSLSSVVLNASSIGGSASLPMVLAGANVYTNSVLVSSSTIPGGYNLTVTATDSASASVSTNLAVTVVGSRLVWNGAGSDNNWSSNPNWSGGVAPEAVGDSVIFAGTTRLTPLMNGNYSVTGVTFSNTAGSFVVGTSSSVLTLTGSGITNNSANAQTLNVPVVLWTAQTLNAAAGALTLGQAVTNGGNLLTVSGGFNSAINGVISGSGGLVKTNTGTLTLSGANSYLGNTTVNAGRLVIGSSGQLYTGSGGAGSMIINSNATVSFSGDFGYLSKAFQGMGVSAAGLTLDGGTLEHTGNSNAKTIQPGAGRMFTIGANGATIDSATAGQEFSIGYRYDYNGGSLVSTNGGTLTLTGVGDGDLNAALPGAGGLVKSGTGTWKLTGTNYTYTGGTVVKAGMLVIGASAKLTNTPSLTVSNGATLNVTNVPGFSIRASQTLRGNGSVNGAVTINGTLAPGDAAIGKLTFSNSVALAGNANFRLNKAGATLTNDTVAGATAITAGGALNVSTNTGTDALTGGENFTLFNVTPTGTFTTTNLPSLAGGLNWWTTNNYRSLFVNRAPTVGNAAYARGRGMNLTIPITNLLTHVTDADGNSSALQSVGSGTNGATIWSDSQNVYYVPSTGASSNYNDNFTYTVNDGFGGLGTGNIQVTVTNVFGANLGTNNVSITGNTVTISMVGIPGCSYALETATNSPMGPWWPMATNTANTNGVLIFTDPNATNWQQYYRTALP
jgi:autotransporter-associated beta strand protein